MFNVVYLRWTCMAEPFPSPPVPRLLSGLPWPIYSSHLPCLPFPSASYTHLKVKILRLKIKLSYVNTSQQTVLLLVINIIRYKCCRLSLWCKLLVSWCVISTYLSNENIWLFAEIDFIVDNADMPRGIEISFVHISGYLADVISYLLSCHYINILWCSNNH